MRSSVPARLGLALTVLLASGALALAGPVAAQAYSGDAASISNTSAVLTGGGASRNLEITFDVAFADPVAGSGSVDFGIFSVGECGSGGTTAAISRFYTGDQTVTESFGVSTVGYVSVQIIPNDGGGGPGPITSFMVYTDPLDSLAPVATVHADPSGTSGYVTVITESDLANYSLVSGLWDGASFAAPVTTSMAGCLSVDIPFSGLAVGDVFQVQSADLPGTVLASYSPPPAVLVDASAGGGAPAAAEGASADELAYTGSESVLPPLALAVVLLGAGSYLALRRRRRVGPSNS